MFPKQYLNKKLKILETKIIQFTAGNGPIECTWVVAKTFKIFLKELEQFGLQHLVLNTQSGDLNGTLKSTLVEVKGDDVEDFIKHWKGTIKWVGTSTYRPNHKRKNWFIGVHEIPKNQVLQFKPSEFQYSAFRSSGPGGQHVNKVSSAIRAVYLPTKTSVVVMESRSQHQNKKIARIRLIEKLEEKRLELLTAQDKESWQQHQQLERGSPVRVFNGSDFKSKPKQKLFPSKRQQLKQQLRKELWD